MSCSVGDGLDVSGVPASPSGSQATPGAAEASPPSVSIPNAVKSPKVYIVFSPEGTTAPVVIHTTHKQAAKAAWFMAERSPGQTFFIMKRAGRPAFKPAETARKDGEA